MSVSRHASNAHGEGLQAMQLTAALSACLPVPLSRLLSASLPAGYLVSESGKNLIAACCTEFIQLLSSESNEMCTKEQKTRIMPHHVIQALHELEYDRWIEEMKQVQAGHEQENNGRACKEEPQQAACCSCSLIAD